MFADQLNQAFEKFDRCVKDAEADANVTAHMLLATMLATAQRGEFMVKRIVRLVEFPTIKKLIEAADPRIYVYDVGLRPEDDRVREGVEFGTTDTTRILIRWDRDLRQITTDEDIPF